MLSLVSDFLDEVRRKALAGEEWAEIPGFGAFLALDDGVVFAPDRPRWNLFGSVKFGSSATSGTVSIRAGKGGEDA